MRRDGQRVGLGILLSVMMLGCKDLTGTPPLPAGTVNPGVVQTAAGAAATAVTARAQFQDALGGYVAVSGLMTDELRAAGIGQSNESQFTEVDARLLDQSTVWSESSQPVTDQVYGALQAARGFARQAIAGLVTYAPATSANARGELYALTGYAELMLADLFCSGVPLSTLNFQGDYTYQPGSTTQQVYLHAIALFDTALTLAADSAPVMGLARVGQGRAYLALGQYASAGQAVSSVPLTFLYVDSIYTCDNDDEDNCPNGSPQTEAWFQLPAIGSVSDREAGTGLPFLSSGDPRTASDDNNPETDDDDYLYPVFLPNKYPAQGINPVTVASGIEAQLITAEAQLNSGNASAAFATLNALRTGSAVTAGQLPTLVDPGTVGAEVDTLFMERAAWLFVDGHRQGDLRRLVRQYEHTQQVTVLANQYPSGAYPGGGLYGTIHAPIPASELANPLFTGCMSRD